MTDNKIKITNVSNPAAFGVEWSSGDNGNRFQLINPRGTMTLVFGALSEGSSGWRTVRVADPSQFGMSEPPKIVLVFLDIADRYVNPA